MTEYIVKIIYENSMKYIRRFKHKEVAETYINKYCNKSNITLITMTMR